MHELDTVSVRVLGCLIEKQRTTPDQYPLSLNSLRLACNQTSNRDPVLDLDESAVRAAVQRLGAIGWARLTSGPGSRTAKYRHLLEEALDLTPSETALLAVLMLRGEQTAAELRARCERLHRFASVADVDAELERLAGRELAQRLERRPGRREERWAHSLGGERPGGAAPLRSTADTIEERLTRVEAKLEELERALVGPG